MSKEKYYNKIMLNDKMNLEEAENIIDEMYQDKHKIIEENNKIDLNKLNDVQFTNLEFASVIMLREVESLRLKIENLQKEIEIREHNYQVAFSETVNKYEIQEKIEELKQNLNVDNNIRIYTLKDSYILQIEILEEIIRR